MINTKMQALGEAPNIIREIFAYGLKRKDEIGAENVFDFSIGNPSVPAPKEVAQAIAELNELPSLQVHGYTPSSGAPSARKAVAESLNRRFGGDYTADNIYMSNGASTSIGVVIRALVEPEDEIIVISPFFPEYTVWIEANNAKQVMVQARESDFQIDIPALEAALNEHTKAIIVNSPNNPVGVVYTPQTMREVARVLSEASERIGRPIFLISDEPYRELIYGDAVTSWVPDLYPNTIVCYSWSKSLSLPGERIGYVLVPNCVQDWRNVFFAICGAGRALSFICAGSMMQYVAERCVDVMPDIQPYIRNRKLLCDIMDEVGFEYIEPDGAFYLWVKSPEPDAVAFADRAKKYELLLVPSDSFGVPGWVRLGYCVSEKTIVDSAPAFRALKAEYE